MNKQSTILVYGTVVLFACSLFFLPSKIVSHIDGTGYATSLSNKYLVFAFFSIVDFLGSFFWNKLLEGKSIGASVRMEKFLELSKTYFSFLALLLLSSILVATYYSTISTTWILLVGHFLYVVYFGIKYF